VHVHCAAGGSQALELLENEHGAGFGLLKAEDSSLLGAHQAEGLGSPHPGPPPRPCFVPDDSKGSVFDPDTVAHEHRSFFFPDNWQGPANAACFGWRIGV
jgi:hypothetical protein